MTSFRGQANVTGVPPNQSDQKVEKTSPLFGNVAKTVAKISKLKLKAKIIAENCF
jgi:hypothetical protein